MSLEKKISEFLLLLLEILQTLLLMKMKMIEVVWVRGGKRRRLQREEGAAIEDVGSQQDQTKLVVAQGNFHTIK